MQHSELITVKTFGSRPEVDIAKSALASAGIDAIIEADTAGRMREHLAWSGLDFVCSYARTKLESRHAIFWQPQRKSSANEDEVR